MDTDTQSRVKEQVHYMPYNAILMNMLDENGETGRERSERKIKRQRERDRKQKQK